MSSPVKPYLWFLAAITGCQDYLFAPLCPESIEESTITAVPIAARPADILFIVDNSGSMADDQRRIAASFDVFINELSQVAIADYQIAVVTTDLSTDGGEKKGEVMLDWGDAPPFEVERSSGSCTDTGIAHGCFRGPIITSK